MRTGVVVTGVTVPAEPRTVALCQIIALGKTAKSRAYADLTTAHHMLQRVGVLGGLARYYQPKDDEGEQLPPESTRVQVRATEVIDVLRDTLGRFYDLEFTRDDGNTIAKADIVVDGATIATAVPVTYLLFLEKQLTDLRTFVAKLPVLDPADSWSWDETINAYATQPVRTTRTKKVPRNHVLAPATDKHPAQVQMYHEDVLVGYWTTVKHSGALPQARVTELLSRVDKLAAAVKVAREQANATRVPDRHIGAAFFDYLLGR